MELEIKPGLTWSQQVGVAIAVLVEDKKAFLVEWANEVGERWKMTTTQAARTKFSFQQIMFAIAKRANEDTVCMSDNDNGNNHQVAKAYQNYGQWKKKKYAR